MGTLEIHVFVCHRGNMLQYKLTHTMWTFIIHAFVLYTDNMLGGGEDRGEGEGGGEEGERERDK